MSDLFGWFDKRNILQDFEDQQQAFGGGSPTSRGQVSCVSTSQCASGFACIDGICTKIDSGSDQSGIDTAGDCDNSSPDSICNGSRACSDNASCGGSDPPSSCCGQAVSYRVLNPETGKLETSCDKPGNCNPFCSASFAALGYMPTGCEGKDPCLSACEYCGLDAKRNGKFCQKKLITQSIPCYCDNGARCALCRACDSDPSSSNFGNCYYPQGADVGCQQCITKDSHYCCGKDVGPITACSGEGKTAKTVLRETIEALCSDSCETCEKTSYEKYCSDSPNYDQMPDRDNLPNGTTQTGYLSIAGVECYFFEVKDRSDCEECVTTLECHCHNDCGPGQACNNGVCIG